MTAKTETSAIISPEELAELLKNGKAKILDATYVLPGADFDPKEVFKKERIGTSQFFDLKDFSDPNSSLPHMLPSPEDFARKISALGISSDDLVIIYAQNGMVMGPARAWWMFRVFGHDNVRVLDGGLSAWKKAGLPVETDAIASPSAGKFNPAFRRELVLDLAQMKNHSSIKDAYILDARAAERFAGTSPEPRTGLRAGHIPGSVNLPTSLLIDSSTGRIKSKEDIKAILKQRGIDSKKPILTTCGSGVTASFLTLALFEIGEKIVPVYDGSWSEWGLESSGTPVACAKS